MTNTATFQEWLAYLGVRTAMRGQVLEIREDDASPPLAVIKREGNADWSVVHERRIPRSTLDANWRGVDGSQTASVNIAQAAGQLAAGFPLVRADTYESDGDAVLTLRAPLCVEGLAAQGFLLTVSAVLKAAEGFDLIEARKADEMHAWAEFQSLAEQRLAEQRDLIENAVRIPEESASITAGSEPETTISSQATVEQETQRISFTGRAGSAEHPGPTYTVPTGGIYAWTTPDPTQPHTATLQAGVPLHVIERWGDWAHVLADNGWSGWVDGRPLEMPRR